MSSNADSPDKDGTFDLTWSSSAGADNYSVFIYDRNITYISKRFALSSYEDVSSSFTISGLMEGDYYCIVAAYNATGEKLSDNIYVKVSYPPGQFVLSSDAELPDTDGAFNLTWTSSARATSYSIFQYSKYITNINDSLTLIGTNQTTNSSFEVTGLDIGFYYYIVQAYNGYDYTESNCIEVNIQFYDEITGYWELAPFVIDDTGTGHYNWSEVVTLPWCSGSGTSNDPYIIEFIKIDGNDVTSCITIRESDVFFTMRNSSFFNAGNDENDDAGIKLMLVSNGMLLRLNSSRNNANGIVLDSCQYINITSCSVNYNSLSGILIIDSNYTWIIDNTNTISYNDEYGIRLIRSHNNNITNNIINNNLIGIYLDNSDFNFIDWNTILDNGDAILDHGQNNYIGNNNITSSGGYEFPIELIIIIGIIAIAAITSITVGIVVKRKLSQRTGTKLGRKMDKKQAANRKKLEKKMSFVDNLIKENKINIALKNLEKVRKEADASDFNDIFNKANERITHCNKLQREPGYKVEPESVVTPMVTPIATTREMDKKPETIRNKLQKELTFVDDLIKEKKTEIALKKLNEIESLAKSNGLIEFVNEAEQKIIEIKKLELDTINRIKQTITNLGMKFSRLQLQDISEKSDVKNEVLIEKIIQEMLNKKEIRGEYFASSKALALEVTTSMITREKKKDLNVFLSYSTLDADHFEISRIVRRLEIYSEISNVYFWEADSGANIVTYMEKTLQKTNVFVLFCTERSTKSKAVEDEWQAAFQLRKEGLMKIVPVYEKDEHLPYLLKPILNVKFSKEDFDGFIHKLYEEILR